MKRTNKRFIAILFALALVVSLTGVALAYAPTGYAVVSFTQDNFDTLGSYTGTGSIITLDNEDVPPAPVTVLNTAISVADVTELGGAAPTVPPSFINI